LRTESQKPLLGRVTLYNRSFYQQQNRPNITGKRSINDKFNSSFLGEEQPSEAQIVRKAKEVAEQNVRNNRGKLLLGGSGRQKSAETATRVGLKQRYKLMVTQKANALLA